MNEHSGWHEYKDGKRFNPECLACVADDRDSKQHLFELLLREQTLKSKMDSIILITLGVGEEAFKKLPHLGELQKRIMDDYKLFQRMLNEPNTD